MASAPGAPAGRGPLSFYDEAGAWLRLLGHASELNRRLTAAALELADVRLELGSLAFIEGAAAIADETRRRASSIMDDLEVASNELKAILRESEARAHELRAEAEAAS